MKGKTAHQLFKMSILLKGLDGLLEVGGGVALFFVSSRVLQSAVSFLIAHELSEDPRDKIANFLHDYTQGLSSDTQVFAGVYLLGHGFVKIVLVAGMLQDRLWAYRAALIFLSMFIVYQLYRFTHTHSPALLFLSVFDGVVVALVWRESRLRTTGCVEGGVV